MSLRSLATDLGIWEREVESLQRSLGYPFDTEEQLVKTIYVGEVDYITPLALEEAIAKANQGYCLENIRLEFKEDKVEDYNGFMETRLYMNVFAEQQESDEAFEQRKIDTLEKIKTLQSKIESAKLSIKELVDKL